MGYWELDGGWIGDDSKYEDEFPLTMVQDGWLAHSTKVNMGKTGTHVSTLRA